jgi:hypothetical protein
MCLVLYIGSDNPCPLVEPQDFSLIDHDDPSWPSKVVQFAVEEIAGDEKAVANHFDTRIVRYVGSFEGCGCGFNASYLNEWEEPSEPDERFLAGKESRRLLQEYVERHEIRQIYACWSGDEALQPTLNMDIDSSSLTDMHFQFPERAMLKIQKANKSEMATPRKPSD